MQINSLLLVIARHCNVSGRLNYKGIEGIWALNAHLTCVVKS